jgi:hypothetical protein
MGIKQRDMLTDDNLTNDNLMNDIEQLELALRQGSTNATGQPTPVRHALRPAASAPHHRKQHAPNVSAGATAAWSVAAEPAS